MSIYDKDQNEINGILQTFPDAFFAKYGEKLGNKKLINFLEELLRKKEQEFLKNSFDTLSPLNIKLIIKTLHDNENRSHLANESEKSGEVENKSRKKKHP